MKLKFFLPFFFLFFIGCASFYFPSGKEILLKLSNKKGLKSAELNEGRALLVGNCANCHLLVHPTTLTIPEWEEVLPRMAEKADLSKNELEKLKTYIFAVKRINQKGETYEDK